MAEDRYVSGGVNWDAFTLEALVAMVSDKASVPQLERLADDWRETGQGVVVAADYLADALDDLMNFWSGASANQARHTVALNAQWIGDLGVTAKDMGGPIDEAAGALRSAQEAMPKLPETPAQTVPGSAPRGAEDAAAVTDGSPLGAAVGATAAGTESAFQSQAEQEELKRIAVETMQRFEAAALGIDEATPQFQGQNETLRPRADGVLPDQDDRWLQQVDAAAGVEERWQLLTGMTDASAATARASASVTAGGFGGDAAGAGPVAGLGTLGGGPDRLGAVIGARPGLPVPTPGFGSPAVGTTPGMTGPIGAPMAGAGTQPGGQEHRRRVPFEDDDPFDTGETASKPVIGL
jgi:hypothetical protein